VPEGFDDGGTEADVSQLVADGFGDGCMDFEGVACAERFSEKACHHLDRTVLGLDPEAPGVEDELPEVRRDISIIEMNLRQRPEVGSMKREEGLARVTEDHLGQTSSGEGPTAQEPSGQLTKGERPPRLRSYGRGTQRRSTLPPRQTFFQVPGPALLRQSPCSRFMDRGMNERASSSAGKQSSMSV
jgi:hypothetical protein